MVTVRRELNTMLDALIIVILYVEYNIWWALGYIAVAFLILPALAGVVMGLMGVRRYRRGIR